MTFYFSNLSPLVSITLAFALGVGLKTGESLYGLINGKFRSYNRYSPPIVETGNPARYSALKNLVFVILINFILLNANQILKPLYYYTVLLTSLIGFFAESKIVNN